MSLPTTHDLIQPHSSSPATVSGDQAGTRSWSIVILDGDVNGFYVTCVFYCILEILPQTD